MNDNNRRKLAKRLNVYPDFIGCLDITKFNIISEETLKIF